MIVAGGLWLRYTNEPAVWLATSTGAPTARKWAVEELPHRDAAGARGAVPGAAWDLSFRGVGRPYVFPHPLARRVATTQFVIEEPLLSISGWFEVDGERHEPDGAPGHRARVWSARSPLYCSHTERARLTGPGLEATDVAYEFASRSRLEGWTISV